MTFSPQVSAAMGLVTFAILASMIRPSAPTLPRDNLMTVAAISALIADFRQLLADAKPLIAEAAPVIADLRAIMDDFKALSGNTTPTVPPSPV